MAHGTSQIHDASPVLERCAKARCSAAIPAAHATCRRCSTREPSDATCVQFGHAIVAPSPMGSKQTGQAAEEDTRPIVSSSIVPASMSCESPLTASTSASSSAWQKSARAPSTAHPAQPLDAVVAEGVRLRAASQRPMGKMATISPLPAQSCLGPASASHPACPRRRLRSATGKSEFQCDTHTGLQPESRWPHGNNRPDCEDSFRWQSTPNDRFEKSVAQWLRRETRACCRSSKLNGRATLRMMRSPILRTGHLCTSP